MGSEREMPERVTLFLLDSDNPYWFRAATPEADTQYQGEPLGEYVRAAPEGEPGEDMARLRAVARAHLSGGRCCVDDHPEWLDDLIRSIAAALRAARAAPEGSGAVKLIPRLCDQARHIPTRLRDQYLADLGAIAAALPPAGGAMEPSELGYCADPASVLDACLDVLDRYREVRPETTAAVRRSRWALDALSAAPPAGGEAGAREALSLVEEWVRGRIGLSHFDYLTFWPDDGFHVAVDGLSDPVYEGWDFMEAMRAVGRLRAARPAGEERGDDA